MNIFTRTLFLLVFLCISAFSAKAQLKASFTYKDTCQAREFDFINTSTAGSFAIKEWRWTFTQGTKVIASQIGITSADADAKAMFFAKDTIINVKLEVTDQGNNKSSVSRNITIRTNMKARMAPIPHCSDTAFGFRNISTFITTKPPHSTTITATNYVFYWGDGTFNSVSPASWKPNTSDIVTHKYAKPGPYTVSLVGYSSTGCRDSYSLGILVYGKPLTSFIVKQNYCEDSVLTIYPAAKGVNFRNTTQENYSYNLKYEWNFGQGGWTTSDPTKPGYDPKFQSDSFNFVYGGFGSTGYYDVKLVAISENGCRDTSTQRVYIRPRPIPDFTYVNTCSNAATKFTDKSSTDAVEWFWEFDADNPPSSATTSIDKNPSYIYKLTGDFKVRLTVTTQYGCKYFKEKIIKINQGPFVELTTMGACAGDTAIFINNTSGISNVTMRKWDFGDGNTAIAPKDTFKYIYKDGGTYNVKLYITAGLFNCTSVDSHTIVILPKPTVKYGMNGRCANNLIQFFDSSSVPNDTIAGWEWDFGDGGTSTLKNPTHTYILPSGSGSKNYNVKLTVYAKNTGCSNILTRSETILPGPSALIPPPPNACENTPVLFTATMQAGSKFVTWMFDDSASGAANLSSLKTTTHLFKSGKSNYFVKAVLQDSATGCIDTTISNVSIYPLPLPGFSNTNACEGSAVNFNDTSEYNGNFGSRTWIFDDTVTMSNSKPSYVFTTSGSHPVKLIIKNANGCTDSILKNVVVAPKPKANFTYMEGCRLDGIQFLDSSFSANGDIVKYSWNFGDGVDSVMNPKHKFTFNDTIYNVTLVVTTSSGCQDIVTKTVKLYPAPEPDFDIITQFKCAGNAVEFANQSPNPVLGSSNVEFFWDFGDGSATTTDENPTHIFPEAKTYVVTFVVTNDKGCKDTIKKNIDILPIPTVKFSVYGDLCVNNAIGLSDSSITPGNSSPTRNWSVLEDPSFSSSSPNTNKIFTQSGNYTIRLSVNSKGCTAFKDTVITISPLPEPKFTADTVCLGEPTLFKNKTEGQIANVNYDFGDGFTSSRANPSHTYKKSGIYDVKMTVYNTSGCRDEITQQVVVLDKPKAVLSLSTKRVANSNPVVNFSAKGSQGYSRIEWIFSDDPSNIVADRENVSHSFPIDPVDTGTYYVKLRVINLATGCYDELQDTVFVGQSLGIQIPNVFTPNKDSINDEWKPKIIGMGTTYKVIIMNRWGQEVYTSNNYDLPGWKGDFQGDGVISDESVFQYFIQVTDFSNENIFKYKGNITLLK